MKKKAKAVVAIPLNPEPNAAGIGTELLADGRRIPFVRTIGPNGYVATFYGSHDATAHMNGVSLLVKHERRGTTTWGANLDGFLMARGNAQSVLQGEWDRSETRWLYLAVSHVRHFPHTLKDFTSPESAGSIIHEKILTAINTGNSRGLDLLKKCIAAVDKEHAKPTKRQMVAKTVHATANCLNRIPNLAELSQAFENAGGDSEKGNFLKALRDAGFGWLVAARKRS